MFYELFLKVEKRSGSQLYAKCPLHPDTNASFTINEDTGEWFCHGCAQGGKEPEFISAYFGVSHQVALAAYNSYEKRGQLPFPTEDYVTRCQEALQERPREIAVLNSFGISNEIIEQFKLGYDDCRITIPIYSQTKMLVNVRKYLPPHRRLEGSNNAKVINVRGCGENRFFPYEAFEVGVEEPIVIVEGEKDCLAARSQGINAVTGLAGTSVPLTEVSLFKDRDVYIMTDTDGPGRKVAKAYAAALRPIAGRIQQIQLPVKDFVDFYRECPGQDIYDFIVTTNRDNDGASVEKTLLSRSEEVAKLNNWVVLENMSVIGTDPKTYTIPCKLRPVCRDQQCQKACPAQNSVTLEIDVDPRQMVQFVDSPDRVQDEYLRKMFGCKSIQAEPLEYVNVQKILFQEAASFMDGLDESSFEHRFGMFLYEEQRLSPTSKYNFECNRVADPRTQQNYYVIRDAKPVTEVPPDTTVEEDNFIDYFQGMCTGCNSIQEILEKHYKAWMPSLNIEGRMDLFGAIILTYLSVTEIEWRGGRLKGWLDTMVIGDTRTGKSQMAQRFVKTLKLGGYINGENARATGVIGGVQKMGDSWVITWGAIPMNDKGLLIVDEASGLTVDDIKDLSATRSSGAVTINKIAKGEARARTRLIWLSNPRSGRNLEDFYWRGYGAFIEFIPVVEDQARYDLVLTAAREDVPTLKGFDDSGTPPPIKLWQDLVRFAWSVTAENIVYSKDVARTISNAAHALDAEYGGGPLVVGVAVHEKLIRLSCAIACLCGSIAGDKLLLNEMHVEAAVEFLKMTYDKPSLDYKNYIQEYKRAQKQRSENTKYVRGLVELHPALKVLLSSNVFRGTQVREVLGVEAHEASKIISELLRKGLLKVTGSGAYAPDKLLIEIAKQMEV